MQGHDLPNITDVHSLHQPNLLAESSDEDSGDSDYEMGSVYPASCAESQSSGTAEHLCTDGESSLSQFSSNDGTSDDKGTSDDEGTSNDEGTSGNEGISVASGDPPRVKEVKILMPDKGKDVTRSVSVNRIKIESFTQTALKDHKAPLLAYFKQCSHKEYLADLAREDEIMRRDRENALAREKGVREEKVLEKREKAKLR